MRDLADVEALFHRALSVPAGRERLAWLKAECGLDCSLFEEVSGLLDARERLAQRGAEMPVLPAGQFGAWRPIRLLGRGGMSAVYLAERADGQFRQTAALKVMAAYLADAEFLRRFEAERQFLASLNHHNITRLLDGGVSSAGDPFLVSEYIDGEPIGQYCDKHLLGIEDRLRLFLQVCEAVNYTHRHLIVHRDLKPANILVNSEGEAKLLDFGTAAFSAVGDHPTVTRMHMLTPRYASPEQLRGERVHIATDVFSLGVILYELLTGAWPFGDPDSSLRELDRSVGRISVIPPPAAVSDEAARDRSVSAAQLRRLLRGDLSAIAGKALRHEPNERYDSVRSLASDLENYLEQRPVSARAPSAWYNARKFLRRRWLPLSAAAIFVFGLVGAAIVAERQEQVARAQALRAENVNRFLNDMLSSAASWGIDPKTYTVAQMLEVAEARLDTNYPADPWTVASLRLNLGASYVSMAQYDRARPLLQRALAAFQALHDPKEVAWTLYIQADLAYSEGRGDEAVQRYEQALEQLKQLGGAAPPELAYYARLQLAKALSDLNRRLPEAQILIDEAIALLRRHSSLPRVGLAGAMGERAAILRCQGKRQEAEAAYRAALATGRSIDPNGIWQHDILFPLADLLAPSEPGRAAEFALQDYQLLARTPIPDSRVLAIAKIHWLRFRSGDPRNAAPEVLKAMAMVRQLCSPSSLDRWSALSSSAHVMNQAGHYSEAESLSREMLPILEANHLPQNDERRAETLFELGTALHGEKKESEAAEALRQSAGIYDACGLPAMADRARRIANPIE